MLLTLVVEPFTVTEFGGSANVERATGTQLSCSCKTYRQTSGLCSHSLSVAEKEGTAKEFLDGYRKSSQLSVAKAIFGRTNKRGGALPKQKKRRRGKQKIESSPIIEETRARNEELDFPKPCIFSEVWHNHEPFHVVFTEEYLTKDRQVIMCETCLTQFPKTEYLPTGQVIRQRPYDIGIKHLERYEYFNHKTQALEKTRKRMQYRFYCVKKDCLLKKHPYFWNGRLVVDEEIRKKLYDSHKGLLLTQLNYKL